MSSGAWLRTASDVVTAVAAAAGAGIGGLWAYFRYRRQEPDLPRVNVAVIATLMHRNGLDYLVVDLEARHEAGAELTIEHSDDFDHPSVVTSRIEDGQTDGKEAVQVTISTIEVFTRESELGSGEKVTDRKIIPAGARTDQTVGYEVRLVLTGSWDKKCWTWSANAVVGIDGEAEPMPQGSGSTSTRGSSTKS